MGSGGTLVDGVRRWFQRRTSTNTNTRTLINNNNSINSNNNPNRGQSKSTHINDTCDHVASVSELRAQSSRIRKRDKKLKQEEGEFDIAVLKLVKVPKRTTMDSFFSLFGDLGVLVF